MTWAKKRRKSWIILDRILALLFPVTILIQYSQKGLGLEFYLVTILFTLMFISILKRLWNDKQFSNTNRESNR